MALVTIVTGAYKPTYNWGGHIVCLSQLLNYGKSPFLIGKSTISMAIYIYNIWLVVTGTMEFCDFPETVGNVIIPT